ncbi:hypothetical protein EF903_05455 [Streptomyces sp. WAC05292]|uniref:hypothetical protein n=1 Tax=Streptomyces sp. WAC05292 TaxID=2487418 RepID=UPI000F74B009|nr:hypothetical protein [Streptomyces sp. WAC05292]RSS95087.1 hypothetical protein EF903_05455 [Streptomyces sp. WAC05292]
MTTLPLITGAESLYPLITAGQAAVRAAESHGTPEALAAVDKALCELPVNFLDAPAEETLHGALRTLTLVDEDAEEWKLLADVEHTVSLLLHHGPTVPVEQDPAVKSVVKLAGVCLAKSDDDEPLSARAWERAYWAAVEALALVVRAVRGEEVGGAVQFDRRMTAFLTAVRRAIPYRALCETRRALFEAASSYGLFAIEMRQPVPTGRWDWARRIKNAVYRFELVPPLVQDAPYPYGSVAVQRLNEDGMAGPVRYFPLGPDEERRRAVSEALFRI